MYIMSDEGTRAYSDTLMNHFLHPRNVGEMPDADGVGRMGDPDCGDVLLVWIRVDAENRLTDVKFRCKGCPAAIACGSMMTELAVGLDLDAASDITDEMVEDALGGLPPAKRHCSNMAAAGLQEAILNFIVRSVERERVKAPPKP